jgi:nucleoside-diphosphate-sugar epimerase
MKKILLTGSEGEVGSALLPQLAKNFDATGFDIRPHEGQMKVVQGDLRKYEQVRAAVDGVDAVVHVAALLPCDDQSALADLNVRATANVLQACVDAGVNRFVYCSTVWASGHGQTEPYQPIDEEVPCDPVCLYGITKLMGEQMTRWYERYKGLDSVIIRFCGYTEIDDYGEDGKIDWAKASVSNLFQRYFGGGFKLMNPVDLGNAFSLAIEKPGIAGERFVIGCYTPYTAEDRAALLSAPHTVIEKYYPGAVQVIEEAGVEIRPVDYYFSHKKATEMLGFRSHHDLADVIRLYREQRS